MTQEEPSYTAAKKLQRESLAKLVEKVKADKAKQKSDKSKDGEGK